MSYNGMEVKLQTFKDLDILFVRGNLKTIKFWDCFPKILLAKASEK